MCDDGPARHAPRGGAAFVTAGRGPSTARSEAAGGSASGGALPCRTDDDGPAAHAPCGEGDDLAPGESGEGCGERSAEVPGERRPGPQGAANPLCVIVANDAACFAALRCSCASHDSRHSGATGTSMRRYSCC